jgi:carbamoyltransferase
MHILGLSAFYHDSAACLVRDGDIIAAAQEERFTRRKHDASFPKHAVEYCLREGAIKVSDLDFVAFYEKPFLKFDRILHSYLAYAPAGLKSFLMAIPLWIRDRIWMKELIGRELCGYAGKIIFPEHHESHAASAFFPSPYPEAAFLTVDGVGEWTTTSYGVGRGNQIELRAELQFPHSLGLLYSAFTYFTGFKVNSGEYKLMGLAPYGEPKHVDVILRELIDLKDDGSFRLNMKYFNYGVGLTMTSARFEELFGRPPRQPDSRLTQSDMDLARSIQDVMDEIMFRMARHVRKETGLKSLCLAGGVALNCVANGRILREGLFENLWIQPAAGDAGGALGAALLVWYQYLENQRNADGEKDSQHGSYLGPEFSRDEIRQFLIEREVPFTELSDGELPEKIADLIQAEKVIGWFAGRMEFGPRALGARSIIGDARSPTMQEVMNLKIKFRESFRPFAPSVLRERVSEYFELDRESPYMLLVAPVAKSKRREMPAAERDKVGLEKLLTIRSAIPAVTHVDYSARVQTVREEDHPAFYRVVKKFADKYGCPVIINTSFNVRGEPIVCTPEHAYLCFMRTNMDYLVLGNFLVEKKEQSPLEKDIHWLREFELD